MGLSSSSFTLLKVKSEVRAQTSTISQQESGVIELQLNDLVHHALTNVRSALDRLVDDFYRVEISVTPGTPSSGLYTCTVLSAGTVWDLNKVSLWEGTLKEIPIYPRRQFDGLRSIYTSTDFGTTKGIATIFTLAAGTIQILVFSQAASLTGLNLIALRPPTKETTDANTVDLPDRWVPLAIDHCTMLVFRRLAKQPPAEVEGRVTAQANMIASLLGAQIDPQKVG
jgi:hypothetical protein